jgi:hypothetical protein
LYGCVCTLCVPWGLLCVYSTWPRVSRQRDARSRALDARSMEPGGPAAAAGRHTPPSPAAPQPARRLVTPPRHSQPAPTQATPACVLCWTPGSSDPAACSSCVAGKTGVPASARAACFGCYQKSLADATSCGACLKAAATPANAQVCPLCGVPGASKADQGQCYSCMSAVGASLPGVRWLCHLTGTADANKPMPALTAAVPRYHKCLAAATSLEAGQGCRKCMDAIEKGGAKAGDACFAAL